MVTLLAGLILLFQHAPSRAEGSDPKDRLFEAIRETRPDDAQRALAELALGDGAKAARAVIIALPRSRERLNLLMAATLRARESYQNIDTSFNFDIKDEVNRARNLELAAGRIKEATIHALEGERVYDSVRHILGFLKPEAVPVIAAEIERNGQWFLKCELLDGLGAMGAKEALAQALDRESSPVFTAAALSASPTPRGVEFLTHPQWQVRLAALDALRTSRAAVGPIVESLAQTDLRYRRSAAAALVRTTETELPADPEAWRAWWKAHREDFDLGAYSPKAGPLLPGVGRTFAFYDIPVHSSRVCFVVDRSRSMKEQGRFDAAKAELRRLFESMPEGSLVNIIFFGGSTACFAKSPRVLDDRTRRDAIHFVDRMGLESGTDLFGALEKSLTMVGNSDTGRLYDDGVDTVVVLSDGQATTGKFVDDDLIGRVIARKARYLRPVFHTVSLSSDAKALKLLAELTGGEYRAK